MSSAHTPMLPQARNLGPSFREGPTAVHHHAAAALTHPFLHVRSHWTVSRGSSGWVNTPFNTENVWSCFGARELHEKRCRQPPSVCKWLCMPRLLPWLPLLVGPNQRQCRSALHQTVA